MRAFYIGTWTPGMRGVREMAVTQLWWPAAEELAPAHEAYVDQTLAPWLRSVSPVVWGPFGPGPQHFIVEMQTTAIPPQTAHGSPVREWW